MIVKPNREQPECIRHLHINVKKLEEVTNEKMNEWFNEPAHPRNKDKRKYLKEIFKIARQEERYLDGAIGKSCSVSILMCSLTISRCNHPMRDNVRRGFTTCSRLRIK